MSEQEEIKKIFAVIAEQLKSSRHNETFTDSRGSFSQTLSWAESALKMNATIPENIAAANNFLQKCRTIFSTVNTRGWNVVTKRVSVEHGALMVNRRKWV